MKDPGQKRKQLWNVIIPQVCTEVINEMIILAISLTGKSMYVHPEAFSNGDKLVPSVSDFGVQGVPSL